MSKFVDVPAQPLPAKAGAAVLDRLAAIPKPPPGPVFDRGAPLESRAQAILAAKLTRMEEALAAGDDVSMVDIQRLADAVSGKATMPADDTRAEYDLSRLEPAEVEEWARLADKARVLR